MRVQDGESGSIWLEVLVNCVLFARDGVRIAAVAPLVVSVYYLYASSWKVLALCVEPERFSAFALNAGVPFADINEDLIDGDATIPSMPRRPSASARARPARPTSSGSVSIVTTNARAPGGQFVLRAKALPDNPYDGHTLRDVIEDTQKLTGCEIERSYVDKGYRGHDAENPRRVFISGQKRGIFGIIKRELRRRSAIEPVIGHLKAEGHLGRCYLKGRAGDAANAILSAIGYNFRRILAWLRALLR